MPAPNPDELIHQAHSLIVPTEIPVRQVDLRRAVSTAYYAIFHLTLTALADLFVGSDPGSRASNRYQLVYRSVDHRLLKMVCEEASKQTPGKRWAPYIGVDKTGGHIKEYAAAVTVLQDARHEADYDPLATLNLTDVRLKIGMAGVGMDEFKQALPDEQRMFLTVLLCPPRG